MCGIVAVVSSDFETLNAISKMNDSLVHRGPDDAGSELLTEDGAALAMRRLSILDVEGGHQPMWDERREHCVVFNGEIYNFAELRRELESLGHQFQTGHSDTEVIVHGFEQWGPELLPRLNGMFAFAVWDRAHGRLFVARDRTGQKPLYLAKLPKGVAIASELKALFAHPCFSRKLDPTALSQYLSFDFIVSPRTIVEGVQKLPPGHFAWITGDRIEVERYWTLDFDELDIDESEAIDEFDRRLSEAVQSRMVADVPVGLFLSGGLDSTTVGYYMRQYSDDVHSFSIAFDDATVDESGYSSRAAHHLGTKHQVERFSEARVLDLVSGIPDVLDEPMGDPSILPTYLLSQFTRGHVKVALGGDGSDEFLMGYKTFHVMRALWELDRVPMIARRAMSGLARRALGQSQFSRSRLGWVSTQFDQTPEHRLFSFLGSFRGKGCAVLAPALREQLDAPFHDVDRLKAGSPSARSGAERTIAAYAQGYLSEDILVKVDRASMAASLEVRSPFLDPSVVEYTAQLPARLKLKLGTRKYLLKQMMRDRIPDEVIDRPKQGFVVPLDSWLRGALQPMAREYLSTERLHSEGVFEPAVVRQMMDAHMSGRRNHGRELWSLLQFQLWSERWLKPGSVK